MNAIVLLLSGGLRMAPRYAGSWVALRLNPWSTPTRSARREVAERLDIKTQSTYKLSKNVRGVPQLNYYKDEFFSLDKFSHRLLGYSLKFRKSLRIGGLNNFEGTFWLPRKYRGITPEDFVVSGSLRRSLWTYGPELERLLP
jgi:hypothetical protein